MEIKWEDGFSIAVKVENDAVRISANKHGLLSLANHLTALTQDNTPGTHIHLDEHNSLEEKSCELIVEKTSLKKVTTFLLRSLLHTIMVLLKH